MQEEQHEEGLRRSLKARHMNMIAIGGAIGTGLFVAGGETVSTAGPGGALVAYSLIGIMVYFLMTSLGEMAAYLPVSGSFENVCKPLCRQVAWVCPGMELLVQLGDYCGS